MTFIIDVDIEDVELDLQPLHPPQPIIDVPGILQLRGRGVSNRGRRQGQNPRSKNIIGLKVSIKYFINSLIKNIMLFLKMNKVELKDVEEVVDADVDIDMV